MLLSPMKHGLTPLFKEVRVFKGFFLQRERRIHTTTLMFTIHYRNSRANGSLITPITFTDDIHSNHANSGH